MRRLVATSKGQVELDVGQVMGLEVRARTFDHDGWEQVDAKWTKGQGALADFLARSVGLPEDEAAIIATQTLDQWNARGGPELDRIPKKGWVLMLGVMGAPLLAVAAVVALVVVLIVWLT